MREMVLACPRDDLHGRFYSSVIQAGYNVVRGIQ